VKCFGELKVVYFGDIGGLTVLSGEALAVFCFTLLFFIDFDKLYSSFAAYRSKTVSY
jgi:hypothetical protein